MIFRCIQTLEGEKQTSQASEARNTYCAGWRRLIGSPKLQIIFHKRATKYRSLLRKMTYKDKGSYESSIRIVIRIEPLTKERVHIYTYIQAHTNTLITSGIQMYPKIGREKTNLTGVLGS